MKWRRTILIAVSIVALVVAGFLIHEWMRPEVEKHLLAIKRMRRAPYGRFVSIKERFSMNYLLWNLQGRKKDWKIQEERNQHLDALVKLGYLEKKVFSLPPERDRWNEIKSLVRLRGQVVPEKLQKREIFWVRNWTHDFIEIATPPDEMKLWPEIIRQYEAELKANDKPAEDPIP